MTGGLTWINPAGRVFVFPSPMNADTSVADLIREIERYENLRRLCTDPALLKVLDVSLADARRRLEALMERSRKAG